MTAGPSRPWLIESLESVLSQSGVDVEVVVVADRHEVEAPRSELDAVLAEIGDDPRVTTLTSDGRGESAARNRGLAQARGEWIAFCGSDDVVPDGAYSALLNAADDDTDLVLGRSLLFGPRRTTTSNPLDRRGSRTTIADDPTLLSDRTCAARIFRRSAWESQGIGFAEATSFPDLLPVTRSLLEARAIGVVSDIVAVRRRPQGAPPQPAAALIDLLTQESSCLAAIRAHGDDRIDAAFAEVVFGDQLWKHVTAWLSDLDATPGPHDPTERAGETIATLLAEHATRSRDLSPQHRLVLGHLLARRWQPAASAALAAFGRDDEHPATTVIDRWVTVLDEVPVAGTPGVHEVAVDHALPRCAGTMLRSDENPADLIAALRPLVDHLRLGPTASSSIRWEDLRVGGALQAMVDGDLDAAGRRLEIARTTRPVVVEAQRSGGSVHVVIDAGTSSTPRSVALALIDERSGAQRASALAPDAGRWRGAIQVRRSRAPALLRLAVTITVDDLSVTLPLRASRTVRPGHDRRSRLQLETIAGSSQLRVRVRRRWVVRRAGALAQRVMTRRR